MSSPSISNPFSIKRAVVTNGVGDINLKFKYILPPCVPQKLSWRIIDERVFGIKEAFASYTRNVALKRITNRERQGCYVIQALRGTTVFLATCFPHLDERVAIWSNSKPIRHVLLIPFRTPARASFTTPCHYWMTFLDS